MQFGQLKRREFMSLLGGAAAAWPIAARAQQGERVRHIGVLMPHSENDAEFHDYLSAFREGLQKLGWTEGRSIQIDSRWGALEDEDARQRSAKELIALRPELILTQNTPPTAFSPIRFPEIEALDVGTGRATLSCRSRTRTCATGSRYRSD
jgi:putative tryptophan/tyrosine transport system substrate-binding protein